MINAKNWGGASGINETWKCGCACVCNCICGCGIGDDLDDCIAEAYQNDINSVANGTAYDVRISIP